MLFSPRTPLVLLLLVASTATASDWLRFRGDSGTGLSDDAKPLPTTWSDQENLKWKCELPGPGLSSPIIVGDKIFLTCWTGYAAGEGSSDNMDNLKRALVCVDRNTGKINWSKSFDAVLPEDQFRGMFAENGYASHTPVSDGERVYCFFGKSGVYAFDMEGEKLWDTSVGTGLDPRSWGSASSPVLYKDKVIITAGAESESIVALNKLDGKEVWKQEAPTLSGTWTTPVMVQVDDERTDIVLNVPGEVWGLNPDTGKLRWYCIQPGGQSNSATGSLVVSQGPEPVAYVLGSRDSDAVAVRVGGKGDVSESHMVWTNNASGRIGTPVLYEGRLYWVSGGIANCIDAETGDEVYKERLRGASGGGGGRGRGGDYSSAIIADGKLYYMSRGGDGYVIKAGDDFEQLATNRFDSDTGEYSATPAVSDGQLFIRSTTALYCVEQE
ncbi:PQQ-binding-like beta-propeller repeat protein [Aeoliella sp.]|uniref:outer membrane protein assembly factor BamB family protein n=1 Tax=Aeoliella sp. TaxID=2795800 RepID=UPI003CCB94DD